MPKHFNPHRRVANQGVTYVQKVVDEMGCVWRPTPNDDVGIDGEIELGKEGVATGQIIKVQVKSGRSYVVNPKGPKFDFLADDDDLQYWEQASIPVILVVYDPEKDEGYWKSIKQYIFDHPEVKAKPHRITFSRGRDRFLPASFMQLCGLLFPEEAELTNFLKNRVTEPLYSNLLLVTKLPPTIYRFQLSAKCLAETEFEPDNSWEDFVTHGNDYISFRDPRRVGSRMAAALIQNSIEADRCSDYVRNPQTRAKVVGIWNSSLSRFLLRLGLQQKDKHRFYFPPEKGGVPREIQWTSLKRTPTRRVAYPYVGQKSGETAFWVHHALTAAFHELGGEWFLKLTPGYVFTRDGHQFIQSSDAGALSTSRMSQERNYQVLNHLYFWVWFLKGQTDEISIPCGTQDILVSPELAGGIANFGIGKDKQTLAAILNSSYDLDWGELETASEEESAEE